MAIDLWSSPVELRHEDGDHSRCIRNSREAVAYLKTGWPAAHDATYAHAMRECLSALNYGRGSKEAREAFIAAAANAKLLNQ
jgi:hypothetical protein